MYPISGSGLDLLEDVTLTRSCRPATPPEKKRNGTLNVLQKFKPREIRRSISMLDPSQISRMVRLNTSMITIFFDQDHLLVTFFLSNSQEQNQAVPADIQPSLTVSADDVIFTPPSPTSSPRSVPPVPPR